MLQLSPRFSYRLRPGISGRCPGILSFLALVVALVCLSACGAGNVKPDEEKEKPAAPGAAESKNGTQPARQVAVSESVARELAIKDEAVERRNLAPLIHVTGQIKPDVGREVNVNTRFSGRVTDVSVVPGQFVEKGAVLARVDSQQISELQAELIEAKSKLGIAEAQEERERQIYEEQLLRPKTLIQARTHFDETKVQLELAESEYHRQEGLYREKISSAKDYLSAKANMSKAKAAFVQAQVDLQREERLYANKAMMKRDYQLAQAESARARQHMNTLQQRLTFLGVAPHMVQEVLRSGRIVGEVPIVSPARGVVTHQGTAVGEVIGPEDNAFTITDLSTVVVAADLPEMYTPRVKIGSRVQIKVSSYPNEVFSGTISYIGEHVNPETRTVPIRARLANQDRRLKSNMFAEIDLEGEPTTILACPKSAVQEHDGRKMVFVHVGDGYQQRFIETGSETEQYFEAKSGLKEGERVATQGSLMLKTELTYHH